MIKLCLPHQTDNSKGSEYYTFGLNSCNKQNTWHIIGAQYVFVEWTNELKVNIKIVQFQKK